MQLKLKVLEGSRHGAEVPVPGPKFFIGRDEDCHLRPQSDMVSRHHCVLLVEQGYAAVRDFGSRNGTFVNGQRIESEQSLQAGDKLTIGPLQFEIVIHHGVGGPKRPKVKDIQDAAQRTASQKSGDDFDVANWLVDEETVIGGVRGGRDTLDADSSRVRLGEEPAVGDTRAMQADLGTDFVPKHEEPTIIGTGHGAAATDEESGGRFPPTEKPKAKDTQSAAVDVLKQLRKQQQQLQQNKPKAKK